MDDERVFRASFSNDLYRIVSYRLVPYSVVSCGGCQESTTAPLFHLFYTLPTSFVLQYVHTFVSFSPVHQYVCTSIPFSAPDPGSRPSDENMYFVLAPYNSGSSAAQGAGFGGTALPAGWDASIRGMCVGERRVISLPASLAFGKDGLSLKKTMGAAAAEAGTGIRASIPPNTPIVIDVRLLSLNGVA